MKHTRIFSLNKKEKNGCSLQITASICIDVDERADKDEIESMLYYELQDMLDCLDPNDYEVTNAGPVV